MSPFWTHGFAMRSRGSVSKWFANGQSDIVAWFGAEAEELYRTGIPASGDITGSIAATVLADVATPHYQQVLTGTADDPLGVSFDDGVLDSFDAANATVHDYSGSFAILIPVKFGTTSATQRNIIGKRNTASPYAGYELRLTTTTLYADYDEGAPAAKTLSITHAFSGELAWILIGISEGANICILDTSAGNAATQAPPATTSNATAFSLGSNRLGAGDMCIGPTIVWSGANAETVIASRATTLPAWWAS